MADGILAVIEQAVDECFVHLIVGDVEVHLVDFGNHGVPAITPRFHRGAYIISDEQISPLVSFVSLLHVGHRCISCTADESVEQLVGGDDAFQDSPETHTVMVAVGAAWLIIPRLKLVETDG